MSFAQHFPADNAALLVVDVQEKLLPATGSPGKRVVANVHRLISAARLLEIPVLATEQYPKGLGPTVASLADAIPVRHAKTTFQAADAAGLISADSASSIRHVTLVGLETHVCILQTALELLRRGFRVQVVADAIASRDQFDHDSALSRLQSSGAILTTTEAVMFEWIGSSDHPAFKAISALVKNPQSSSID